MSAIFLKFRGLCIAATLALAGGSLALSLTGREAAAQQAGPVILTVTGDVSKPNRGGFDPGVDKFFEHNAVEFREGTGFDYLSLEKLDMIKVRADFPKGGDEHEYEGPSIASVLEAAGADGDTVTAMALDGYAVEVPVSYLVRNGAILALKRDGHPMAIGGFGPTQIVFPRAERDDLKEMNDDYWIWSVFHMKVQ
ncbi:hypothetical protein FDP22_10435 [Paroceanicella profunda]|uniref:Molybdopterin-dependent oxidoreductase n=1 Tax=Paroceanicella profunda TaxID=2579971 RepID=A0A5B8G132_9RHOB|nr:hypothetical protein [Paroceanicella profunda]QDL92153.1 hypothetical protein FDP22_10435 [Paroceanicella profunda]